MAPVGFAVPVLAAGAMVRSLMMELELIGAMRLLWRMLVLRFGMMNFVGAVPNWHALRLCGPTSGMHVLRRVRSASRLRVLGVPRMVARGATAQGGVIGSQMREMICRQVGLIGMTTHGGGLVV